MIEVTPAVRRELMKLFGCSAMNVWRALNYQASSPECCRIRRAAIEKGGRVINWLPECETLHCADGQMCQTFQNGVVIVVDWADRTVTVCRKGTVVREVKCSISLEDFHELQAWAESI